MNLDLILQLLNLAVAAGAAESELAPYLDRVRAMQASGAEPTAEQWADLLNSIDLHAASLAAQDLRSDDLAKRGGGGDLVGDATVAG